MAQLSFYSAEANPPARGDLAGLLCGPGRIAAFGGVAARLSVTVGQTWRGRALVRALADRGVEASLYTCPEGLLVRTAFRADLSALAAAWSSGEDGKTAPDGLTLGGGALRLWVLAAGDWTDGGYRLALDPLAPATHERLALVVAGAGLPATLHSGRDEGPGLRISGRRRLARLAELVGRPPLEAAEPTWPAVSRVRQSA
ncbi:hypothetical protein BLA60_25955 [Actinophytocola xinjiangensis]|uniref:Uncharacterized protein n=1 Tax=Actinophytocola xinjiangensis TaxID=485602 RepID=A0A7Z0WJA0_9PSEU|nr:hypothetical protein [Actinophytocola xinjiangensis]OLF07772.1 hypothetical protein BLA60_25955 [Actinophytocola xinjiangensis]